MRPSHLQRLAFGIGIAISFRMHMSFEAIENFALGRGSHAQTMQTAQHLLGCKRCMAEYEEIQEYVDTMKAVLHVAAFSENAVAVAVAGC